MEDDDIDIYEDLPSFETKESQGNKELSQKCSKLEAEITGLKAQVEGFRESKKVMERNISSLMKTAKAEIARKDRMIAQLRRELDNAAFRRGKTWKKQPVQRERYKESEQIVIVEKAAAPFVKAQAPQVRQAPETIYSDESEEEIEMVNEKPNNLTSTVFGERLKRKLMLEQEAERIQREEAKIVALEKAAKVEATKIQNSNNPVKREEEQVATLNKAVKVEESRIAALNEAVKVEGSRIAALDEAVKVEEARIEALNNSVKVEEAEGAILDKIVKVEESTAAALNEPAKVEKTEIATLAKIVKVQKDRSASLDKPIKVQEEKIASSGKPVKTLEEENKNHRSGNGFVSKNEEKRLQEKLNGAIEDKKTPDRCSASGSTSSRHSHEEDNKSLSTRRALKTKTSDKREGSANSDFKRKRGEEDRLHRDDTRHHNGHSKYEDNRHNFESLENHDYSKNPTKYADHHKRNIHSRDDYERVKQLRGEKFKSSYRSHSNDQRYDEQRPERHRTDKYRAYNDKHEKRRDYGHSREDDNWIECNKGISDLRSKIESKVGGSSEYNNYNDDPRERNYKRQARTSHSPEKDRSRSSGRTRDKDYEKRRSRRSRSSDRFISSKTAADSDGERRKIERSKNSKATRVESKDRDTQSEVPPAPLKNMDRPNEATDDKISSSVVVVNGSHSTKENTTLESSDECRQIERPKKDSKKDSKTAIAETNDHNAESKIPSASLKTINQTEETKDKISVREVAVSDSLPDMERQNGDAILENVEPTSASENKLDDQVDNTEKSVPVLENDTEVALIPSSTPELSEAPEVPKATEAPEATAPASRSFREEKIENIEKFIQDYQENENFCVPVVNEESDDRVNSSSSTDSIVDTLSMDIEEFPLDKNSEYTASINSPQDTCRLDINDVAAEVEVDIEDSPIDKTSELVVCNSPPVISSENVKDIGAEVEVDTEGFPLDKKSEDVASKNSPDRLNEDMEDVVGEVKMDDVENFPLDKKSEHVASNISPKTARIDSGYSKDIAVESEVEIEEKESEHVASIKTPDPSKVDIKDFAGETKVETEDLPLDKELVQSASGNPVDTAKVDIELPSHDEKSENVGSNNASGLSTVDIKDLAVESEITVGDSLVDKKSEVAGSDNPPDAPKLDVKDVPAEAEINVEDLPLDDKSEKAAPNATPKIDIENLAGNSETKIEDLPLSEKTEVVIVNDPPDACEIGVKNLESKPEADIADMQRPDEKSENAVSNEFSDASRTDIKDVADKSEEIPKIAEPTSECPASLPSQTLDDEQSLAIPETSEIKKSIEKMPADKVVEKQLKRRSKTVGTPIMSRYSKRKPSILADSEASHCIIESESTKNTEADNISNEETKTRRIPMEELNAQQTENSTNKSDSQSRVPKKQAEDVNSFDSKKLNLGLEMENATNDSGRKGETKMENSENALSASVGEKDFLPHQTTLRPDLSSKLDAAPKLRNALESAELRETRSTLKTIVPATSSTDSRSTNRKRALPKAEAESQSKPPAKQCKIVITARRRRPMQLEDSCIATTLVPSRHSVHNEFAKNICLKVEKPESSKLVTEPAIKGRKRRSHDSK